MAGPPPRRSRNVHSRPSPKSKPARTSRNTEDDVVVIVEEEDDSEDEGKLRRRSPVRNSPGKKRNSRGTGRDPEKRASKDTEKRDSRGLSGDKRASKASARSTAKSERSSNVLSIDSLAKLNAINEKVTVSTAKAREEERQFKEKVVTGKKHRRKTNEGGGTRKKKRVISGPLLENGRGNRGGYIEVEDRGNKRKWFLIIGIIVLLLIILIPVGVLVIGKQSGGGGGGSTTGSGPASASKPPNTNLNGISQNDIPTASKGSYLDPFTWYDTEDFNVTYTNQTVGGLPIMGLNSTWDDTTKANQYVPALNETFNYGQMPIRGVNLGGWLSIEPFITPSLFSSYEQNLNIVDEYTLCQHLGASSAAQTLEKHYSSFVNEQTFADIQAAGFDHVRIPFSYWAIATYDGDPYVPRISWRYLLRGIEWARKHGLRINLDLHAVPGSQNGWNHSGRQGVIGWINGTDGATNAQRSLDIHGQISAFFAQPRYKDVIGIYGLVNEPKMTVLPVDAVLTWTTNAINIVRQNGIKQTIAFGDGFLGLPKWQGKLQGVQGLVMDAHQYVIFNTDQIAFSHQTKINFACSGWNSQMTQSINVATG